MKVGRSSLISIIIVALTFSGILQNIGLSLFGFFDEIVEIVLIILSGLYLSLSETRKHISKIVVLLLILVVVGLLGNVIFKYQTSVNPIIIDVIATIKGVVYYVSFSLMFRSKEECSKIITKTYNIFKFIALIILPFCIVNQFVNIGMSHQIRYGIKGFSFVANGEGNFALIFYTILTSLVCYIAIRKRVTQRTKIEIIVIFSLLLSTLRSRMIAYAMLFILMNIMIYGKKRKKRIEFIEIILIVGILVFASFDTIQYYFENTKTARYNLLYYGFVLLVRCFPIGSGFGTYGSAVAAQYYSKLYIEFGFNSIYGLAEGAAKFSNDGMWGEIFGQFGILGTIVFVAIFVLVYKKLIGQVRDKFEYFAILYVFLMLLLGSIGTKTFFHYVIAPTFMLLALLGNFMNCENIVKEKSGFTDDIHKK